VHLRAFGRDLFEDSDDFGEISDAAWLKECRFVPPVQGLLQDGEVSLVGTVANLRCHPHQSKTMLVTANDVDIGTYSAECVRRHSVDQLTADERERFQTWAGTSSARRDELLGVAHQRRSPNFGIGGRIVSVPPLAELEQTITPEQEAEADLYLYLRARRQEMLELMHSRQNKLTN